MPPAAPASPAASLTATRPSLAARQAAFSPDGAEVDEARQLAAAFEEHAQRGVGAFVFRGKMIDQPTYLQAKALLRFAERAGL